MFCVLIVLVSFEFLEGVSNAGTVVYDRLSVRGQSPAHGTVSPMIPSATEPQPAPSGLAVPADSRQIPRQIPRQDAAPPSLLPYTSQYASSVRSDGFAYPSHPSYSQSASLPPIELEPETLTGAECINYGSWKNQIRQTYEWQMFPDGLIWPAYLAGVKESRFRGVFNRDDQLGWIWDITLGGRTGILRYGNRNSVLPSGMQLDIEGAAMTRLALDKDRDVEATDYRFGLPLTFGNERWQFKFSYYHVSCHLGDEYMLRYMKEHPDENGHGTLPRRINYYRDSLVFGIAFRPHRDVRLYGEVEYAVYAGEMTERFQMQVGAEYTPLYPANRARGVPFLAVNGLFLEELDFGGSVCVQVGWMWRGRRNQAFRIGFEYFYGADDQYEFFDDTNSKCGLGVWYDF